MLSVEHTSTSSHTHTYTAYEWWSHAQQNSLLVFCSSSVCSSRHPPGMPCLLSKLSLLRLLLSSQPSQLPSKLHLLSPSIMKQRTQRTPLIKPAQQWAKGGECRRSRAGLNLPKRRARSRRGGRRRHDSARTRLTSPPPPSSPPAGRYAPARWPLRRGRPRG